MKVQIMLFAHLREAVGQSPLTLDLPEPATAQELYALLAEQYPALKPHLDSARLAINQTYVPNPQAPIAPGDELALIPPVSGG